MKVIQQLIQYFVDRGSLTRTEIDYLSEHGFWTKPYDEYEDYYQQPEEPDEEETPDWWEATEAQLEAPRKKRRRSGSKKVGSLTIEELRTALADCASEWENPLRELLVLAPHGELWKDAAVAIRQADTEILERRLRTLLTKGGLSLARLWEALRFESFRSVINLDGYAGAVRNAYRILLTGRTHSELGRFTWILRHRELRGVYNLIHAQRRCARLIGETFTRDPKLISRAIRRHPNASVYWSFVLLYNADRYGTLGFDTQSEHPSTSWVRRHHLVHGWEYDEADVMDLRGSFGVEESLQKPDRCSEQVWREAWSHALWMNPAQVTPLFAQFYGDDTRGTPKPNGIKLWCPNSWPSQ